MSMRAVLSAAVAGAFLAMPVQAQHSDYSTKETRALMHDYARCVVKKQARKASEALLSNVDNSTILRTYKMLVIGDCLARQVGTTTKMSFGGDLYRYALADALVNQELGAKPVPAVADLPRLDHRDPGEPPQQVAPNGKKLSNKKYREALDSYNRGLGYSFLGRYGECVVRLDPAGAKSLLLTKPDSSEEEARFTSLESALGNCLPEGHTLKFGKVPLRGAIAINYYRLAHAAAGRAAG